jgi:hypothetical protein
MQFAREKKKQRKIMQQANICKNTLNHNLNVKADKSTLKGYSNDNSERALAYGADLM